MKNLTWQNPEQLFVAQVLINKVKSKCCGIKDELVCAIQIKPKSYLQNAPYIVKARQANSNKYAAYKAKFGVSVLTVISTSKGEIQNKEVLTQIRALI